MVWILVFGRKQTAQHTTVASKTPAMRKHQQRLCCINSGCVVLAVVPPAPVHNLIAFLNVGENDRSAQGNNQDHVERLIDLGVI